MIVQAINPVEGGASAMVAVGVLLIWNPIEGALSLTIVLTALFIVEGIFQIVTSVAYRHVISASWRWMLVSGISDPALAAIIILSWPMSASWPLALLVGIKLMTSGWAIVMMALAGRDISRA